MGGKSSKPKSDGSAPEEPDHPWLQAVLKVKLTDCSELAPVIGTPMSECTKVLERHRGAGAPTRVTLDEVTVLINGEGSKEEEGEETRERMINMFTVFNKECEGEKKKRRSSLRIIEAARRMSEGSRRSSDSSSGSLPPIGKDGEADPAAAELEAVDEAHKALDVRKTVLNGSATVSMLELCAFMMLTADASTNGRIKGIFHVFDLDSTNKLDRSQAEVMVRSLLLAISRAFTVPVPPEPEVVEICKDLFDAADSVVQDDMLSYVEWATYCTKKGSEMDTLMKHFALQRGWLKALNSPKKAKRASGKSTEQRDPSTAESSPVPTRPSGSKGKEGGRGSMTKKKNDATPKKKPEGKKVCSYRRGSVLSVADVYNTADRHAMGKITGEMYLAASKKKFPHPLPSMKAVLKSLEEVADKEMTLQEVLKVLYPEATASDLRMMEKWIGEGSANVKRESVTSFDSQILVLAKEEKEEMMELFKVYAGSSAETLPLSKLCKQWTDHSVITEKDVERLLIVSGKNKEDDITACEFAVMFMGLMIDHREEFDKGLALLQNKLDAEGNIEEPLENEIEFSRRCRLLQAEEIY